MRRQGKHLVELTLCATMQEWVMRAAGAKCWTSIWYVSGDDFIVSLQVTKIEFFLRLCQCLVTRMERKRTAKSHGYRDKDLGKHYYISSLAKLKLVMQLPA